jgi:hypothetical protein
LLYTLVPNKGKLFELGYFNVIPRLTYDIPVSPILSENIYDLQNDDILSVPDLVTAFDSEYDGIRT